jgi:ferredoxin
MRVKVDDDLCIACGNCIESSPEVYEWNDDETLAVSKYVNEDVPEHLEDSAREGLEICPVEAIKEVD